MFSRFLSVFIVIAFASAVSAQEKTINSWYDSAKSTLKETYSVITAPDGTEVKHGRYNIFFQNGKIWQEGSYENGKLQGLWKDYYEDGALKQELLYDKDLLNGETRYYYPSGKLQQKINYRNDLLNGMVIMYYENGNLQESCLYKDNLPEGELKTFYEDGKTRFIKNLKMGVENGSTISYYENGKIQEKAFMKDGKYEGLYTDYFKDHADGAVNKICYYRNGMLNGKMTGFYPTGNVMVECNYVNDFITGVCSGNIQPVLNI